MRRGWLAALVLAGSAVGLVIPTGSAAAAARVTADAGAVVEPASLVNPLAGTGTGNAITGTIGEFPGADVPFGMVQWSPDTTPDAAQAGSGYAYGDHRITGFSLTHLSGAGCQTYQDVPILPTTGAVGDDPEGASQEFSHAGEQAAPGRYAVALGGPPIAAQLAVTTRSGISRFVFPPTTEANVLVKVSGSIGGAQAAAVRVVGTDEVAGQVTSGGLCGTSSHYTVYFVARFDRPFSATGTWDGSVVTPGGTACTGAGCGAYVRFDTATQRAVEMKVGLSYVSTTGAAANLAAEDPGWSLATVAAAATRRWNQLLGRIRVGGGTAAHQRTFYTALYHSLLFPSVVSDANGSYRGGDGLIHRSSRTEYANFSEWDIYRSEIQLVSMLAPTQAGDMVQSLVNDAAQDGWLPKWAMPDGDLAQQNGDSADPLIASAYAFGVHSFNARAALQAMVKGATETESPHGLEIERQYLNQYLAQHYVDASALDLDSITYSAGASMTLEYALDDFSIAQLARALGQTAVSRQMMARAHNWEYLFNPATGYVQGRNADGSFPGGPAFNPALVEPGGTQGFEEGNAVQYTWTVPQDLASLAAFMGGDDRAGTTLTAFMAQLNAGRAAPYDWAGNEPSLWSPWEGDFFGDPGLTQSVVRQILTTLYGDGPVDEPGNDDLGALSSWYVWASLGLFPVTPGTANLALAAPLFPRAEVQLSGGRRLVIEAPAASTTARSIEGLRITGTALAVPVACGVGGSPVARAGGVWRAPWLPASILRTGGTLAYSVGPDPDPRWGAAADDRPPSYGTGGLPALGFSLPSGALPAQVGVGTPLVLGVASAGGGVSVRWTARASAGLTLSVASGTLQAGTGPAAPPGCGRPGSARQTVSVLAAAPGPGTISFTLRTAGGIALPPVVVDVEAAA